MHTQDEGGRGKTDMRGISETSLLVRPSRQFRGTEKGRQQRQ